MTLAELNDLLNDIEGFDGKVAYYCFPTGAAPSLPFICYYEESGNSFNGDNTTLYYSKRVTVELYCKTKNVTLEATVEAALTDAEIPFTKDDTFVTDERVFMTNYYIEV